MRILMTLVCVVAVVALVGCGGSSYLSEYSEGEEVSSLAFTVDGVVSPEEGSVTAKDIVLSHVTGDADSNYGSSYTDAGLHECSFTVASSAPSVVGVDDGAGQTCSDSLNCAVCTIVQGDVSGDPNCSISCVVNVIPRAALSGVTLDIMYKDTILLWTNAAGSSGGALRVDGVAEPSGSHLFDPTSVTFAEFGPASYDGILIAPGGTPDLYTADTTSADGFSRIYNISNTEVDPNSNTYDPFDIDPDPMIRDMAWAHIEAEIPATIDLSNLEVPGTSETYSGGYMSTNAGMWHDSANIDVVF